MWRKEKGWKRSLSIFMLYSTKSYSLSELCCEGTGVNIPLSWLWNWCAVACEPEPGLCVLCMMQEECINTQPHGRQLVSHTKSTAVSAHLRALQSEAVREKRVRQKGKGYWVLYLTRWLLYPVTWYNLKSDAASHLPLCGERHSIANHRSHFHMAVYLNLLIQFLIPQTFSGILLSKHFMKNIQNVSN